MSDTDYNPVSFTLMVLWFLWTLGAYMMYHFFSLGFETATLAMLPGLLNILFVSQT